MSYAVCTVAVAPLRTEPSHRAEMTSQVLFGETVQVLETHDEWLQVRCFYDGYEGWTTNHLLQFTDEATATAPTHFVTTELFDKIKFGDGAFQIPMGSSLTGFQEPTHLLWSELYAFKGAYRNVQEHYTRKLFQKTIQPWLHAPYLWGGKTFMGVDCSGFVQTVFKVMGVPLLRDAYQQAGQGTAVIFDEQKEGDVAFFQNEADRIMHVGFVLEGFKIMHASGRVRIDHLTPEGIFAADSNKQTHRFHSIRRIAQFGD